MYMRGKKTVSRILLILMFVSVFCSFPGKTQSFAFDSETFFPLIVTAILYFLMAVLMSSLVKRIEIRVDPASRKKIKLLKGVKTK